MKNLAKGRPFCSGDLTIAHTSTRHLIVTTHIGTRLSESDLISGITLHIVIGSSRLVDFDILPYTHKEKCQMAILEVSLSKNCIYSLLSVLQLTKLNFCLTLTSHLNLAVSATVLLARSAGGSVGCRGE